MELLAVRYSEDIAKAFGLVVEDGHVFAMAEDGHSPVPIDGKQLVIPTKAILAGTDWSKFIALAPLGEVTVRGPSEIIRGLLKIAQVELNVRIAELANHLTRIAVLSADQHDKMLPEQFEVLRVLAGADKKYYEYVAGEKGILASLKMNSADKLLVRLKLRHHTEIGGQEYQRYCAVTFPCVPEDDHSKVFGVQGRVKDVRMFNSFMDFLFKDNQNMPAWSYGTSRKVAPYLGALLGAYSKVATRLNQIVDAFAPTFPEFASLRVDLSVNKPEYLESLAEMRDSMPTLRGNEGTVSKAGEEPAQIRLADPEPAPSIKRNNAPPVDPKEPLPWEEAAAPVETGAPTLRPEDAVKPQPVSAVEDDEDCISVGELLAKSRAMNQPANPYPNLQQYQQVYAPAPGEPTTLAAMIQARTQLAGLAIGPGAVNNNANFGMSPFDVDYKPPVQPQQQTGVLNPQHYAQQPKVSW